MAAERQKPARLDWRRPGWVWALAAFALGGPLNPLALGVACIAILGSASGSSAMGVYALMAGAASAAMLVAIVSWLAPSPAMPRTLQALGLSVVAVSIGLAISAGLTLGNGSSIPVLLDERINLGLAVLMLSLLTGAIIAASAAAAFRFVALRRTRRPKRTRSQAVRHHEVGST
ncbi:MAG: hypothetical protein Q8R82_11825 [Hyphomonadaceae bacterium]|nr:hypothetical protein [Hyphomonadaceae bacterium]